MAGESKTLKDYMDDAKKRAKSGSIYAADNNAPSAAPRNVNDYMNQAVSGLMPQNPYASLDQDVLYRVGKTWRDSWYYQLNDQEDLARMNSGKMPKYYDSQYNLSDAYDRYLYQNNLPPQSTLNKSYSKEQQAMADEQAKARADAAKAASKRAADIAKEKAAATEEEDLFAPAAAAPASTADNAKAATAPTRKTPANNVAYDVLTRLFGGRGSGIPTTAENPYGVGVGVAPAQGSANAVDAIQSMIANLFGGGKASTAQKPTDRETPQYKTGFGVGTIGAGGFGADKVIGANQNLNTVEEMLTPKTNPLPGGLEKAKEGVGIGVAPSNNQTVVREKNAAKLAEYMSVTKNSDFAEKSAPIDKDLTRNYLSSRYRYINGIGTLPDAATDGGDVSTFDLMLNHMASANTPLAQLGSNAHGNLYQIYDKMTPEEISVLNYTVATRGEREAERYLRLLESELNARQAAEEDQAAEMFAEHPVLGSIVSVPLSAASSIEGGVSLLAGAAGYELGEQDPFRVMTRLSGNIRGKISEQMTPTGAFFYNTGMSMLDTAARLPMGNAGLMIAGLSASSSTIQQAIEEGASTQQAVILAGISGTLEIVTEKLSLDNLIHARAAGNLAGVIKAALIQGGIEASEETASALGNLAADILVRKGDSAWNQEVMGYIREGMSREEAERKTFASQMMQVASQAAGGFVSGLFFGSGGQMVNAYRTGQQQGAKGVQAIGKGMQTVASYDAAVATYKQAMKSTPRYTPEERIAIARDIEASGLSDTNKKGIAAMIDHFAMQPDGWLTDRGQELTEQAIQATRQAAEKGYVATAQLQAKQTRALERLNTMFSDIQTAYKATEEALKRGDLAAHTKAVEATTAAIAKYNSAHKTEQADMQAQKVQREVEQRSAAEAVSAAARKLQGQLPAEMDHHAKLVAEIEAQAAPANDIAVSDNSIGDSTNASADFANAPAQAAQTAATAEPAAQGLTSQPATGIVNTAAETAQAAPAATAGGLIGSVMKNASGVPVYKQQSAPARGNPDVDVMKYVLNGGNPNGRQEQNTVLAGQAVSGLRQGKADNGSGSAETQRLRSQEAGRNGSSAGRGGSDRADARGGEISAGAVWNESNLGDLTQATASINEELTRAGIEPLAEGDLIPYENIDQESAYWLKRMESLSGRKALIYASKSGRMDVKNGFANNGREHVRYQPGRIMAFHFAHEIAENSARIRAAGDKVLRSIGDDSFKNYLRIKGAENADAETQKNLRKEFICDAYGAVMFDIITNQQVSEQLGISQDDYAEFQKAYIDHLAAPAISEETLDKETRANMRGSAYSSTNVVDMAARDDALRARNEERAAAFAEDMNRWLGGRSELPFQLGETPPVLQRIGVEQKPVEIYVKDVNHMLHHSGMTLEEVRQVPSVIQEPIIVMESRTVPDRLTMFGEVFDTNNNPVLVILDLIPNAEKGHNPDAIRVNNAYGKNKDPQGFIDRSKILYIDPNKERTHNWRLLSGLQLPSSANYGFNNIVSLAEETVNTRDEQQTEFSSTAVTDPQTDPYAAAAYQLYGEGVTYESYMNTPDADWRVGKQLNGLWNGIRKIRVMQRALDLFENEVTPAQYWEQNKTHWGKEGDQDYQVLNQLYGMYLRNNVPMGGRLGEGENGQLETLLKDIGSARQFHQMTLTGKSPARLFEDLPSYRKGNTLPNQMKNFRDGEMMRETYFDYLMNHNASRAAYMKAWHDKVQEAFKGGTVRESNLAQLLGEKIVDKENLKQAIYDSKHMLVRAIDGWFVFEHSGRLLAFCDGETTFFRDPNADKLRKAENKASTEAKTATQKARERLKEKFTRMDKSVIRVDRKGSNAVIYIPGIRNPVQIQNGKAPNAQIAIRTADALTEYYAQAWQDQSRVLVENGYAPAKYIPDYFPHLWQEESGLNGVIESFVGYEPPTQIAGLTGAFKPGKPWAAHLQERTGPLTEFDAIRGFNQYVQKAGDVIFVTPAVQRLRQLESYLRTNAGEKFDATAHSTFVEWLRKYTNDIANKKAELDRSAESLFGHEAFSISRLATTLISRSAVQGSLSSALSQTISYIAALPTLDAKSAVKGTSQALRQSLLAMANNKNYDMFEDKVPFLKARFGAYEAILTKGSQKADRWVNNKLSWMFTAMDRFATEAVARAKFDELRSKGRTEEEAGRETSAYCVKLFADRSKGMAPVLMNNKVLKPFLQFQLEVENQVHHFRDIKRQSIGETYDLLTNPQMADQRARQGITDDMVNQLLGNEPLSLEATKLQQKIMATGNAKKWTRMLMYLVFLSLWGEFTRATMGRDQTWNPYGMTKDFIQDVKSDGVPAAVVNLGANTIEQLPYASFATGGRVPIGTGVDKFATVAKDVYDGISEGDWKGLGRHAIMAGLAVTPSGGQLRKIGTGIEANTKKGYYNDSGELRYPVTEKDYVKTILFGPSAAAPEGYDWNDTLSKKNTEAYQSMVEQGYDPMAAYTLLQKTGTTNAEKGLAILTTDSNGDGKPDFQGKDVNIIAKMLGIKYDSEKAGSFKNWTKAAAQKYIEDAQEDGVTPKEQKKIDDIKRMMQIMLGMN